MEYGEKFIYLDKPFVYSEEYCLCIFIMDRKDKFLYLAEKIMNDKGMNIRQFIEISYDEIDTNIFSLEKFNNIIIEQNIQIIKTANFYSKIRKEVKNISDFNKHISAIRECEQQIKYWTPSLKTGLSKLAETIIRENEKGIRRHQKRIKYLYKMFPDAKTSDIANCDFKLASLMRDYEHNKSLYKVFNDNFYQ